MTALAFRLDSQPDTFRDDFARHGATLPGADVPWLEARRRAAMTAFAKTGTPTRRVEAWKYTDLANALEGELASAPRHDGTVAEQRVFGEEGARVLLVNGYLHSVQDAERLEIVDLSRVDHATPDWVSNHLGLTAAGEDQLLGAVSLALMRGGVAIRVQGAGTLHLDFLNLARASASHARVLIVVDKGASLRLFESHTGDSEAAFANVGIELVLKPGAQVEHVRLQNESATALHVTSLAANLGRDARYRALYCALGGRLSRVDALVRLADAGAEAQLHDVAILNGGIADITTVVDHSAAYTTSRQLFKSVVGGRGRSVNQGRVAVRPGAVKSDSHQLFKALLLSPRAEADAKPELEIFADDVVCGHGTAIGDLDADALFYLRARGIPEGEAKSLLIHAFLADAIEGFGNDAVRQTLTERLDAALESLGQAAP
jgi:Fe-S cluster assembly protein SufD